MKGCGGINFPPFIWVLFAVLFAVEVAIIVPVVVTQWQKDQDVIATEMNQLASRFASRLRSTMNTFVYSVIRTAGAMVLADSYVYPGQFDFVLQLDQNPLSSPFLSYGWIPYVTIAERPAFEKFYGYPIRETNGSQGFVLAAPRPLYAPMGLFVPPLVGTSVRLKGFDAFIGTGSREWFSSVGRNDTYVFMPSTISVVAQPDANNFGILVLSKAFDRGKVLGVVGTGELLNFALTVPPLVPREQVTFAAFAPGTVNRSNVLFLDNDAALTNVTSANNFLARAASKDFYIVSVPVLGETIMVAMRFDWALAQTYAATNWVILVAILVPVAVCVFGVAFVIALLWQHRVDIQVIEREKREATQLMLGYVNHEIRNPLQTILGLSDLCVEKLEEEHGDESMISDLGTIARAAEFIEHIANDILDIRRIEEGKVTLDISTFDVNQFMSGLVKAVRSMETPDKSFSYTVDPMLSTLTTDRYRLEQILMNFLTNAFKYTEKGTVKLLFERSGARTVKISVSDTGRGIPPDMVDALFMQFKQVKAKDSSNHGGFGLGLFLTKMIAQLLHGEVGVKSSSAGSTFWVELPIADDLATQFDYSAVPVARPSTSVFSTKK